MYNGYIAYHARVRPRAVALILPQRRVTYAQLDADVNRYARGLSALGLGPASGLVALEASSHYRLYLLTLALDRIAVGTTPWSDRSADLRLSPRARAGAAKRIVLTSKWTADVEQASPDPVPPAPRDPDAVGRVQLSSGSTGRPKRIGRSWRVLEGRTAEAAALFGVDRPGPWIIRTGIDSGLGQALASAAWMLGASVAAELPLPL